MQFIAPVKERPKRRDGPGCRHKPMNKGGFRNRPNRRGQEWGRSFGYQSILLHSSPLAKTDLIPSLISDRITSDLLELSLSSMSSTNWMTFL
jgi:hypothetical protein